MPRATRLSRVLLLAALALALLVVAAALHLRTVFRRDVPERFDDPVENFKYGSIGAETRLGVPYRLWRVLPSVFADRMPQYPGRKGWENVGFLYEHDGAPRPIGTSLRLRAVPLIGLNCAACHVGRYRDSPTGEEHIVLGMPAHQLDLESYRRFLWNAARDPRWSAGTLLAAMKKDAPLSLFEEQLYRREVIPRTREALLADAAAFAWVERRPPSGPGTVDTFNPAKALLGFDMDKDDTVGTADLPPAWNLGAREGRAFHWDANNDVALERDIVAVLAAGGDLEHIDLEALERVDAWLGKLEPPPFPGDRIDTVAAARGKVVFDRECAGCHVSRAGQVTPIDVVGTDRSRLDSFTPALADKLDHLEHAGGGRPWQIRHYRKTDGYKNVRLDGLWLRAPYLHNGSVPTLRDLLKPPSARPTRFFRGYDVYDFDNLGFVSGGNITVEIQASVYPTAPRGSHNEGHAFGTTLPDAEKSDLLEYLKTL